MKLLDSPAIGDTVVVETFLLVLGISNLADITVMIKFKYLKIFGKNIEYL